MSPEVLELAKYAITCVSVLVGTYLVTDFLKRFADPI